MNRFWVYLRIVLIVAGIVVILVSYTGGLYWLNIPILTEGDGGRPGISPVPVMEDRYVQGKESKEDIVTCPFPREDYKSGMMLLSIPRLGLVSKVVQGTTEEYLEQGPGLYEISPLPDEEGGNVCIAGHRNAHGSPFRHVDKLQAGDEIVLIFNGFEYIYHTQRVFIVEPDDWSVTEPTGCSSLTLTSCHPLKPPYKRIVVRAHLEEIRLFRQ
jgi:LPXTG-site transpeptidase (sortase) family protein